MIKIQFVATYLLNHRKKNKNSAHKKYSYPLSLHTVKVIENVKWTNDFSVNLTIVKYLSL